ncbi:hypothetical protein ACH4C2_37090 [Streptomyces sp. NPDC018057]|uniref:hypothetical protein n=1 Tax=unclassified Streptomyces TaxID=2593676 RepID=UPI0037AA3218
MDQGLAAVLGAGVGMVGALATAALTYASTRYQARHQRMYEHAKTLREERRTAYLNFWNAAYREVSEYRDFLFRVDEFTSGRGGEPEWNSRRGWLAERNEALFALDQLCAVVYMVGPSAVFSAADEVISGVIDASLSVRDLAERRDPPEWRPNAVRAALDRVASGHKEFLGQARSVLTNLL